VRSLKFRPVRGSPARSLQQLPNMREIALKSEAQQCHLFRCHTRRESADYAIISPRGEVAEWSKAPDSKSGIRQRIVGSNPTLSASAATLVVVGCRAKLQVRRATERWMSG
jgi:hypothetical protein